MGQHYRARGKSGGDAGEAESVPLQGVRLRRGDVDVLAEEPVLLPGDAEVHLGGCGGREGRLRQWA